MADWLRRLLLIRRQLGRLEVVVVRFLPGVGVVVRQAELLLVLEGFALHADRSEEGPRERGGVLEGL